MALAIMDRGKKTANVVNREPEITDESLVARAQRGDQDAFACIVERYSTRVWSIVSGILRNQSDVEDVVQDVFFKVYRKIGYFEGKSQFYTWLYRVAVNATTDFLKKRRRKVSGFDDLPGFEPIAETERPGNDSDRSELRRRLAEAMAELPEHYRNILVLREYEDMQYDEIAAVLEIPIGTVESRLFRARARLKEKLQRFLNGLAT